MNGRIFALAAVLLILPDAVRMCDAAPPAGSPWKMTFSDEFTRPDLSSEKWIAKPRWASQEQSNVLRDYIEIDNGVCRLLTRKGDDGRTWRTPQFISRSFEQRYGYFEARIRISRMSGLTNVLALISRDRANNRRLFFIDVVHAYYPNKYNTRVGMPARARSHPDLLRTTPMDLSKDYHLYGLHWTPRELIWYFDDREVRRLSHTLLRHPARVQLVTWVTGFSGKATGTAELPAMEVDYVRVYKQLPRPPNWSGWPDGVQ